MTVANFGGAQNFAIDRSRRCKRESRVLLNSPLVLIHLGDKPVSQIPRHKMAKRKSERDPEDLPDASDKRTQQDGDDSGSDEVCALVNHTSNRTAD